MKAIFFAFAATFVYSLDTVIADSKLGKFTPFAVTLAMGIVSIVVSSIGLYFTPRDQIHLPSSLLQWTWVLVVLLLAYAGDLFHFYSLHYKIGAVVLCTSYALQPVVATMLKGEMPSMRLTMAWILAAAALFLAYKEVADLNKAQQAQINEKADVSDRIIDQQN